MVGNMVHTLLTILLLRVHTVLIPSMAEETAAIMICCMSNTATVIKSIEGSVLSWISSLGRRAGSLTTSLSRSRLLIYKSESIFSPNPNVRTERKTPEGNYDHIDCDGGSSDRYCICADTETNTYALQQLNPTKTSREKMTKIGI